MRQVLLIIIFLVLARAVSAAGSVDRANSTLHFDRLKSSGASLFVESEEELQVLVNDTVVMDITEDGVTLNSTLSVGGMELPPAGSSDPIVITNNVSITQPLTVENIQVTALQNTTGTVLDTSEAGTLTLGGETGGDASVDQVVVPDNVTLTAPIINITTLGNASYPQSTLRINNNGITLNGAVTINNLSLQLTQTAGASIPAASGGNEASLYWDVTAHEFVYSNGTNNIRASATAGARRIPIADGSGHIPLGFLSGITSSQLATPYLPLAGGTMTGNIDMGGYKVTGAAAPSAPTDLVTLGYLTGITGNVSASSLLSGTIVNLTAARTGNTTLIVAADVIDVSDGSGTLSLTSVSNSGDISTSGAGGLDSGSVTNSTKYYVFQISKADGSSPTLLFALTKNPTMPATYTRKRCLFPIRTNGSAQIIDFSVSGDRYWWRWSDSSAGAAISGGTATSFTAVDCSTFCPDSRIAIGFSSLDGTSNGGAAVRETGASNQTLNILSATARTAMEAQIPLNSSQSFDYIVGGSGAAFYFFVHGFVIQR